MNILSRLLLRLGYVRLREFGYTLTTEGRIVELPRVTDDRFAPPPWEPVAWRSAPALLPPPAPPVPRPLPSPPQMDGAGSARTGGLAPETPAPGSGSFAAGGAIGIDTHVRTEAEEEEWEWRMALAQARERAARGAPDPRGSVPPATPARAAPRRTTGTHIATPGRDPQATTSAPGRAAGRAATQIGAGPARARSWLPSSAFVTRAEPARPATHVAAPPAVPMGPMQARPTDSDTAGRVARGTHEHEVPGQPDPRAPLGLAPEHPLEPDPQGTDFADGSNRHEGFCAAPGVTATGDSPLPRVTARLRRPTSPP